MQAPATKNGRVADLADPCSAERRLAFQSRYELRQTLNGSNFAGVDIALRIGGDAFAHRAKAAHARCLLRDVFGNEEPDLTGLRASDAQPLAPAGIEVVVIFRVDRVERGVGRYVDSADAAVLVSGDEQLAFLRAERCDKAQGYHFGRPMDRDALEAWIRSRAAV